MPSLRTTPLTDDELRAIEQRLAACTPGPWCHRMLGFIESLASPRMVIGVTCQKYDPDAAPLPGRDNAEFIAHARQDVPRLIAEIRRLRECIEQFETEASTPDAASVG